MFIKEPEGAQQFERMRERVREIYPALTDGQVRHACNVISNGLSAWKGDIYDVSLMGSPFGSEQGYFHEFDVEVGGHRIYVRVTVD